MADYDIPPKKSCFARLTYLEISSSKYFCYPATLGYRKKVRTQSTKKGIFFFQCVHMGVHHCWPGKNRSPN